MCIRDRVARESASAMKADISESVSGASVKTSHPHRPVRPASRRHAAV